MKNKGIIIVMSIIIVVLVAVVVFLLVKDNEKDETDNNEITDALKFAEEYTLVPDDNVFVYSDVINRISNESYGAIGRCDSSGRRKMGFDGKADRIRLPAIQADG